MRFCSSQDAMHQSHQMLAKKESKKPPSLSKLRTLPFDGTRSSHPKGVQIIVQRSMCMQQQCTREKPQPTSIQQLMG